ncbi:MAG TPA: zinc ribbon domain-containing protein [Syntrophales bacterium]|nr:zinc ribbon domain-containing protein [Syntrophales bacterium]HOM08348.1 zinc ribbon domain-containing protein [Syntrophales bacterium]HON23666.1 zinc ribbon domain-containing protein [Syntrophales bacterium]HQJ30279.1 zinc ribbon domain-containing protein [Syntrophales bacterium]
MPIYEYECVACGRVSEVLEGINRNEEAPSCRFCGSAELRRLMSPSVIPRSGRVVPPWDGNTCCGRTERCDNPPCSGGGACRR